MVDPQDKDKIPPELLEDGDDADLEEFSVVVEPESGKPVAAKEAKSNPIDHFEYDDDEENLETQKFERYEEPDLTADLEDEEEGASGISMPSVVISDQRSEAGAASDEEPAAESSEQAEGESPSDSFRTISISHVQVIGGGPPVENIDQPPLEEDTETPEPQAEAAPEAVPAPEAEADVETEAAPKAAPVDDEEPISPWSEEEEKVEEIEEIEDREIEEVEEAAGSGAGEEAPPAEAGEEPEPVPASFDAEIVAAIVEVEAETIEKTPETVVEEGHETTAEESTEEMSSVEVVKEAEEPEVVDVIEEVVEKPAEEAGAEADMNVEEEAEEVERLSREEIEPVDMDGELEELEEEKPAAAEPEEAAGEGADLQVAVEDEDAAVPPPPPKEPPVRTSKEPPPPPKGEAALVSTPPPPPPPKGVSMQAFADHLPSIISIPEDEIPREGADEAVMEVPTEPGAEEMAEVTEVTEVTEVEEIPSPRPAPRVKKRWFEEVFNEDYLRLLPKLNRRQIKREVAFIEKSLGVQPGSMLLDLACGAGTHCIGLAKMGYQMVGLDLSFAMLAIASEEAQAQDCKINFIQKDLRELDFEGVFDGAFCIGSSFGYFDDDENETVVRGVHRALKPGGMFLLEVDNRDFVMRQNPNLIWFEGDGVVTMEETSFDFITSRLKVKRQLLFEDGTKKAHQYTIRMYAVHELGRMLHNIGFRVGSVGGHRAAPSTFIGEDSTRLIILAQKRFPDET
jgi:SAM-dependent methyltransferase